MQDKTGTAKRSAGATEPAASPRVLHSETLLHGAREVRISHAGETYRLTVTRQGKLILTK